MCAILIIFEFENQNVCLVCNSLFLHILKFEEFIWPSIYENIMVSSI